MILLDNVSFFLTQIRNAQKNKQLQISHPYTTFIYTIAKLLYSQGFIRGYYVQNNHIKILLKYLGNKPVIHHIHRISKPSRRVYYTANQFKQFNGNGLLICTNRYGVMSHVSSILLNSGGEVLFQID